MKLDEGVRAVDDVDELASEFVPALAANAHNEKMEGVDDPGFSNVPRREAVDVVGVPASEFFVEESLSRRTSGRTTPGQTHHNSER